MGVVGLIANLAIAVSILGEPLRKRDVSVPCTPVQLHVPCALIDILSSTNHVQFLMCRAICDCHVIRWSVHCWLQVALSR